MSKKEMKFIDKYGYTLSDGIDEITNLIEKLKPHYNSIGFALHRIEKIDEMRVIGEEIPSRELDEQHSKLGEYIEELENDLKEMKEEQNNIDKYTPIGDVLKKGEWIDIDDFFNYKKYVDEDILSIDEENFYNMCKKHKFTKCKIGWEGTIYALLPSSKTTLYRYYTFMDKKEKTHFVVLTNNVGKLVNGGWYGVKIGPGIFNSESELLTPQNLCTIIIDSKDAIGLASFRIA